MTGRVSVGTARGGRRRRWPLRTLVLAAVLAACTTLMTTGVASADFWPHALQDAPAAGQHDR